jgi:hypothetical protein
LGIATDDGHTTTPGDVERLADRHLAACDARDVVAA